MKDQKLDNQLNLSVSATEKEREKSLDLKIGYDAGSWEVIVKYTSFENTIFEDFFLERLKATLLLGGYGIVRVTKEELEQLSDFAEVEYIEKPKRLYFALLQGKYASCITAIQQKENLFSGVRSGLSNTKMRLGLSGKGILVGVVDSGVDIFHKDFQMENGKTRILCLWDQSISGNPPKGYKLGTEFTEEDINEALKIYSETGRKSFASVDNSGHGTAVLGIAAGNGSESRGEYSGIAYESELIVVKLAPAKANSFPRTTELMQGVDYLVRKSLELKMPIAINLSFGNSYGSHRGDSLLETYLDTISSSGRVTICVGTGNNGNQPWHSEGRIRGEERQEREFSIGTYEPTLNLQLWKNYEDEMEIQLESPSGERTEILTEKIGVYRYYLQNTEILVYYGKPGPYHVTQEIYFDFLPLENYLDSGIWKIILKGRNIREGDYEMWLPGGNVIGGATGFYLSIPDGSLTIPSTAKKVISVGAYDSRTDSFANFSGRGSERFLDPKPDLIAPGVEIMAPAVYGGYRPVTGTSFSTPFVSGSAALLMQWGIVEGHDKYLYGEKVKAYLRKGAEKLPGFEEYPNIETGWGKLCVQRSIPL